jgi:hypothetical protein
MKITTLKKLQECFIGKVCTILTVSVNKTNFTDVQMADFFTGIVESIDEDGVMLRHHLTNMRNFYVSSQVVAILEEQVISEDDPNYKQVVDEIKNSREKSPVVAQVKPQKSSFVDPAMMAQLAKQAIK